MSQECKNRFEVQKIFRNCVLGGLNALGFVGWDCMEFGQPSFERADRIVLMNLLRNRRIGWQGEKYSCKNDEFTKSYEWLEEQHWQLHFICKRKESGETIDSVLAEDVASMMITWFNGDGATFLRKSGVAPLRIDESSLFVYNDDSSVYQKRSVFTVKIQVPKEIKQNEVSADIIVPKILPV